MSFPSPAAAALVVASVRMTDGLRFTTR